MQTQVLLKKMQQTKCEQENLFSLKKEKQLIRYHQCFCGFLEGKNSDYF